MGDRISTALPRAFFSKNRAFLTFSIGGVRRSGVFLLNRYKFKNHSMNMWNINRLSRDVMRKLEGALLRVQICVAVAGSMWLGSCEDDTIEQGREVYSKTVSFIPEIVEGRDTVSTKSGSSTGTVRYESKPVMLGKDTFYLNIRCENGVGPKQEEKKIVTKGTELINKTNDVKSLYVAGYKYGSDKTADDIVWTANGDNRWMGENLSFTNSVWNFANTYYWPGDQYRVSFYAIGSNGSSIPSNAYSENANTMIGESNYYPVVKWNTAENDCDLVVGKVEDLAGNKNAVQNLEMKHVLGSIRFVAGSGLENIKIKKVTVKGALVYGMYKIRNDEWICNIEMSSVGKRTIFEDKNLSCSEGDSITKYNEYTMVVPQSVPSSGVFVITYDDGGTEKTAKVSLEGQKWEKGKTMVYTLSKKKNGPEIKVDVEVDKEVKGTGMYRGIWKIGCYVEEEDGSKKKVAYRLEGEDGCNLGYTNMGPYEGSDLYDSVLVAASGKWEMGGREIVVSDEGKGTKDNPWNLSNSSGVKNIEESANCYIVDDWGYYSIPLVYGCGVKNDIDNNKAYSCDEDFETVHYYLRWGNMLDGCGDVIKSGYIEKSKNKKMSNAGIVWQYAWGNVTDVKLVQGEKLGEGRITFKVNKIGLRASNCIIGVYDENNTCVWRWQIWITDKMNDTFEYTDTDGNKSVFAKCGLGYCEGVKGSCTGGVYKVNVVADYGDGSETKEMEISIPEGTMDENEGCCGYDTRYGVIIPAESGTMEYKFVPVTGGGTDINGGIRVVETDNLSNIEWVVRGIRDCCLVDNGAKSFEPCYDWKGETYKLEAIVNLINGAVGGSEGTEAGNWWTKWHRYDEPRIKTVYDPCPRGYVVPEYTVMENFIDGWRPLDVESFKGRFCITAGKTDSIDMVTRGPSRSWAYNSEKKVMYGDMFFVHDDCTLGEIWVDTEKGERKNKDINLLSCKGGFLLPMRE